MNSSGEKIGAHDVEGLGFLDGAIVGTSGKFVRDIDRGYQLIFGENIVIFVASGGDREDAVRRDGIPFHLFCVNSNVNNEGRGAFDLSVPRFREGHAGVGVDGCSVSGRKFEWHEYIVRINQGCASSRHYGGRSDTCVHVGDGLSKACQGGGEG